jgi:hypothetical protein
MHSRRPQRVNFRRRASWPAATGAPQKPAAGSGAIASGIGLAAARQFIAVDFVTSAAIVTPFAPELA